MEVKRSYLQGACFFCLTTTNEAWCVKCEQDFIIAVPRCPVCARHTNIATPCGAGLKRQPYFTSTEVLFNYQYPAKQLIKAFKFNDRPELAHCFAQNLARKLRNNIALPEALIPVPLHTKRQRGRGYNQSLEFATHLARRLGVAVNTTLCKRIINTDPQSTLPMKTRKDNVKDAFELTASSLPKHMVVVDDVITTGSTVNEIAALLKRSGCQRVDVWAIARA
jgi:ComF family protein